MPTVTCWAHVGFTDVIGLFMLCLDREPTQGFRQLSMSSTMSPLYTIDNSSQQCQLAHSLILAVFPISVHGPSIYLSSSINRPTHAISRLLLDGPMWVSPM